MIQFFALIRRKQGITSQEFHDHWRHPHGTMGRNIPSLRSYVQAHQIHTDLLDDTQSYFEGIALSTFDNLEDATNFGNDPYYVQHIQPDEVNFVDGENLQWLNTTEEVIDSRQSEEETSYPDALWLNLDLPTSIQLIQFISNEGNDDWAGEKDKELGRAIGAFRHVRNYSVGDKPFYKGVRQLWWPTLTDFYNGVNANPEAFKELLEQAGQSLTLLTQSERFKR